MDILLIWGVSIVIGCLVGEAKGQALSGFLWSFLLGPLGVLIVLALPNPVKENDSILIQRELLDELKALRDEKAAGTESLPPVAPPVMEEDAFIPENLSGWRGRRR